MPDKPQGKNTQIPNNTFNTMNTKPDPSQQGSPVPFQQGDFASIDTKYENKKTFSEILSFYVLGIALTILSFYLFVTLPIFQNFLNQTILSFAIAFGLLIVSFVIAHVLTTLCTKIYRKKH